MGGAPSPLLRWAHHASRERMRHYKRDRTSEVSHLKMDSAHEKLLEKFEDFEADLEVEEILKKVKVELLLDQGVTEFGELLEEERKRFRQAAQAAQAARATYVREHWTPGHYPQLTCEWFVEGLDFCCPYWRYQFKRPLSPLPAPPPSPDACRKRVPSPQSPSQPPSQTPSQLPTKRRR